MRIHDISLPIVDGGLVYPGNPAIRIAYQQAVAEGAGANVSALSLGSHTGTHVDAAKHFFDDGQTIDAVPLDRLIGRALVVEFDPSVAAIGADHLARTDLGTHTRVLLKTRNSGYNTERDFRPDYTYLAPDGAAYLVERGVVLVGVDYLSVEQFHSGHHRTHRTLLERQVVIVEGLALGAVAAGSYHFVCLPLRIAGIDGAPARAVLVEGDADAPAAADDASVTAGAP
jgi:arylformamidase